MEGGYDELLLENPFFLELKNEYSNLLQHCISESWILCVPRTGRLNRCVFTVEDFCAHILVPSDELPETHYSTLTEKQVTVANRVITVELTKQLPLRSHILFEETFYTEDFLKYKVWCIERPLEPTAKLSENVVTKGCLTSINDCIDLLWTQAAGRQVLDKIEANVHRFIRNHPLPLIGLRALKDSTSELYTECLQEALQNHRLREKYKISNHLLENIKLAVETYMQYLLFNSNFKLICTSCSYEDAHLNKKIRNMSDIQLRHLDIKKELYHAVPKAKHLLSKIYTYNTVLEKIICLKQALNAINMLDDSNNITYLTVDDLLPVLVYLLIKSEVPNWYSQLQYMKEFRFSSMGKKDGDASDFLITTLEAVVEHILSGALAEPPNPEAYYYNSKLTLDNLNSNKRRHSLTESVSTTDTNSREENLEYVFDLIKANCTDRVSSLLEKNRKLLEDFEKNEKYALKLTAHDEDDDDADDDDDDNGENEGEIYQKLCHPLCICKKCCSKILKNLRRTTPTVTSRDRHGLTPLHVASIHGKAVIVDILINMRANVSATDVNEFTPLHYAASRGHQNALLLLLHSGANINKTNIDKNTPLHLAVNNGHIKCVKALIYFAEHARIKLNVNCINDSGNTPLHFASKWGYGGIVKILIENGADPSLQNANNKTAFDYAHNFKIMQVLKSYSRNMYEYIHITSSDIKTLKCNGERCESVKMVKQKLQHLKIGHESDNASKTVENLKRLERIFQAISYSDVKLACFFFGIDYEDCSNYCDPTCEWYCCKKRRAKPLDLDINFADTKYGFTSLHYAAKYGLVELCHILMANKANVNASNKTGQTPLHLAALNTNTVVLRFLLEHGANLNAIDSSGNTPLHDASAMGNIVTTMALLCYNPDISLLNGANKSASDLARENLHLTVFDLIEKYANKKVEEPDVYYRYNINY